MSIDYDFSIIAMGCNFLAGKNFWSGFSEKEAEKTIELAISEGVNYFDLSPIHGFGSAEEFLGEVLNKNKKRNDIFIGTKCGLVWDDKGRIKNDLSRNGIFDEVEKSLKRLKTDYIDIYYCQYPDPNTDIEETMEALVELKKQGKIKYIGLTNFTATLTRQALRVVKVNAIQSLYNMVEKNPPSYHGLPLNYSVEREVFPLCYEEGIAFFPYSPLMQGLLSGSFDAEKIIKTDIRKGNAKFSEEHLNEYILLINKLNTFAKDYGRSLNQIALNYLIQNERVTSIMVGSSNREQLISNLKSTDFNLNKSDIEQLDRIVREFCLAYGEPM